MSRDPLAEARRWLEQARSDLADAEYLIGGGRFSTACFLCQQAAEKAMKGVLYAADADSVLGHGVGDLCEEVARIAPEIAPRCPEWTDLDLFYIPTRYPDALPTGIPAKSFSERQARGASRTASEVLAFASGRIES